VIDHISIKEAAAQTSGADPKNPARARQTRRWPTFWERPAPILKIVKYGKQMTYNRFRPASSERRAVNILPVPSPIRKRAGRERLVSFYLDLSTDITHR
jgi:hypothetical protein